MAWITTWIGRTGRNFQYLQKLFIRDRFISRVETFRSKSLHKGIGFAAIASLFACVMDTAKDDSKQPGDVIRNLEEIVERRAIYYYNAVFGSYLKNTKPVMKVDWSNVEFKPEDPIYQKMVSGADGFCITSHTKFENKSNIDLEHKLKSERQTSAVFESRLTEGFTIGPFVGVSLRAPDGMGISADFTLQRVTGNTDEKKYAWLVEESIKVPGTSSIEISMILKEKEIDYSFTTRIGVTGDVKVTYYNKKDESIETYSIPMMTIITEEFPQRMITVDKDICYITISGKCKFKYEADDIVITPLCNCECRPLI